MYSYPFTTEGIKRCLKEVFNTDLGHARIFFIKSEKKTTDGKSELESVYEIRTIDGNWYRIVSIEPAPDYIPLKTNHKSIKSIRKIE